MRKTSVMIAGFVLTFGTHAAAAQQQGTEPGHAPDGSESSQPAGTAAAPTADELAQIRRRLRDLQERARADSAVAAANDAFGNEVLAAMLRLDPEAGPKKARADAIQGEAVQARAASDNARLNDLAEEGRALQAYFAALRTRVLNLPEIERSRQAYIAKLFEKMTDLDPEAPALVARLDAARAAPQQATSASEGPAPR
jgi:hypothetical protein